MGQISFYLWSSQNSLDLVYFCPPWWKCRERGPTKYGLIWQKWVSVLHLRMCAITLISGSLYICSEQNGHLQKVVFFWESVSFKLIWLHFSILLILKVTSKYYVWNNPSWVGWETRVYCYISTLRENCGFALSKVSTLEKNSISRKYLFKVSLVSFDWARFLMLPLIFESWGRISAVWPKEIAQNVDDTWEKKIAPQWKG